MDTASVIANNLPNTDVDTLQQKSALGNIQARQAQGAQSAFAGIDFSDPTSISNGITNLIKSNNVPAASALAGFAFQQQARQSPVAQAWLNGTPVPGAAAPSASNAAPAATSPPGIATPTGAPDYNEHISSEALPPAEPNAQAIAAHSSETLNQVSSAIGNIKTLPVEERPAAIASLKDQLIQRGVPAEAVDQEANYILSTPDKAGQDARLDEIAAHIGAHADLHGAVAQGQMPTEAQQAAVAASPQSPSVGSGQPWYVGTVNSPGYAATSAASPVLKIAGIDVSPYLQTARELAAPYIAQDAAVKAAPALAMAKVPADLVEEAAKHQINLSFQNQDAVAAAKKAGAVATAQEQAKNPNEFITVKGPENEDVVVRKDYALDRAGKNGGLLVSSMSPVEQKYQEGQAANAVDMLKPVDENIRQGYQATVDNANRGLSIINNIKTNSLTEYKKAVADQCRSAGIPGAEKYASDVAGLEQITNQSLLSGAKQIFPARVTNTDLTLAKPIYGNLKTPHDQLAFTLGLQSAVDQRKLDYEQFKSEYKGTHTPQAVQQAWLQQEGNRSNFQSPVWTNINIGGRPAFNPATDVKIVGGKKVGAWGLGTGHPVYFEIK